jgi:hypothetical protein
METMYGCIFIAPRLAQLNLYSRWIEILDSISKTPISPTFSKTVAIILKDIRSAAKEDVEDGSW